MIKILLVSRDFRHKGGVVNFVSLLCEKLSFNRNLKISHFVQGKSPFRWINIILPVIVLGQYFCFAKKIKNFKPDVIHINPSFGSSALLRDAIFLVLINLTGHRNILVMFHGWNDDLAKKIIKNTFLKKIFQLTYDKATTILVLSENHKNHLIMLGIPAKKINIITTMYRKIKSVRVPQQKNINDRITILFMAQLVKAKGVYITVNVCKLLLENGRGNIKLIIAGDGPEYNGLKDYIVKYGLENHTDLVGYVEEEKKERILNDSDIFLFPTYYGEGCPIVILEAMGTGTAIISTPVAAIPKIVSNNENGFIIDSKSSEPFYKAVIKLIDDRDLLNRIKRRNKEKAEKNYEAEVVTRRIEAEYRRIIKNSLANN